MVGTGIVSVLWWALGYLYPVSTALGAVNEMKD